MTELICLVEEAVEGGFIAKAVGEGIFSEAESLDELKFNIKEAVECYFKDGEAPKIVRLHIVKDELFTL
ncbi:MAG TPA: hypothetical protein VM368_07830 [Flavisolibacter sp.]|nr:hypothetical protein [Flavisolibacter sp.]